MGINYYELMSGLKGEFEKHPFVERVYLDVWDSDKIKVNMEYPCIIISTNTLTINSTVSNANINIYYLDRQTPERDNLLYNQSLGISIINEVLNMIVLEQDLDILEEYTFTPFRDRFADMCAGVFTTLSIEFTSELGTCYYIKECNVC